MWELCQMISPFVLTATYSFKMVVRPFPKTDCGQQKNTNSKSRRHFLPYGVHLTVSWRNTLTNTQAGIVPSPVVWSAYSFRFGLSRMKAWLVADSPSSWRYPGEGHLQSYRETGRQQRARNSDPKYRFESVVGCCLVDTWRLWAVSRLFTVTYHWWLALTLQLWWTHPKQAGRRRTAATWRLVAHIKGRYSEELTTCSGKVSRKAFTQRHSETPSSIVVKETSWGHRCLLKRRGTQARLTRKFRIDPPIGILVVVVQS